MNCSSAADFGDVQLRSYLGQPFSAQLTVSGASQNLIDPNCYKSKVEALDGSVLSVPRITLGKARADGQTAQLFFSSRELINEPAVKFKVESLCDGSRQREYALLLDYPELAAPAALSSADLAKDNATTEVAALTPQSTELPKHARPKSKALKLSAPDQTSKAETQPKPVVKQSRFSMELTPPKDALRISNQDVAADLASSNPGKQTAAMLEQQRQLENKAAQEAFAKMLRDEPVPAINPEDFKRESQKIQSLENEVTHLKLDLQVKNQHEESFTSWLITLNAVVILLFLVVIGVLVYMLKKARQNDSATWWNAADQAGNSKFDQSDQIETAAHVHDVGEQISIDKPESRPRKSLEATQDAAIAEYLASLLPDEPAADRVPESVISDKAERAPGKKSAENFNLFANREIHSIHIEEVSDAMQEAEFWMSINDSARAIEILEPHCVLDHPETPVMWLCLLELYRKVGDEKKYEALRQRFRANFNTNILPFNETPDPASIKHLEDFEHLIAKCCTFWHTSYMLPFLESLLVNDRNEERVGFDLSVYQDILLLIGVCKELNRPDEATTLSA